MALNIPSMESSTGRTKQADSWPRSVPAFIKQGEYAYKYVLVQNGRIDDLAMDQGFLSSQQEYLTFIYFKDPAQNFDRILKIERTIRQ